ncbi:MAG: hypothetical protein ACI8RD_007829 [Bacillariaceae sp.]|jgi:hypothetical protein
MYHTYTQNRFVLLCVAHSTRNVNVNIIYNNYFIYGKNKDKLTPIQKHPLVFQPDLLDSLERLHLMVSIQMV